MSCAFYQLLCAGNQTTAVKMLAYAARIISRSLWPVFTGFVHPSESCFKLAVIVYCAMHGTAPQYLSDQLHRVADMPLRSRLRSASSNRLDIRPSRLVTVRNRSFASAGPRVWNSLPGDVTSAPSLPVFRRKLKIHLFRHSYPDTVSVP